ncbi:MAG: hypothetical protein ACI9MR_001271, partial [Myxococcota bacterium]
MTVNRRTLYLLVTVALVGFAILLNLDFLQNRQAVRMDFRSFYTAWDVAAQGGDIYNVTALQAVSDTSLGKARVYPYLYPPTFAVLGAPLSSLTPPVAQTVWNWLLVVLAGLLTALSVMMAARAGPHAMADAQLGSEPSPTRIVGLAVLGALLLALLSLRNNLAMGQVNVVVLVCITVGLFAFHRDRPAWAGAALAVAAMIKMWPAALLLLPLAQRQWRAFFGFAAMSIATFLLVGFIGGFGYWGDFLGFVFGSVGDGAISGLFELDVSWNFSLKAYAMRLFGAGAFSTIITLAAVLTMVWYVIRRVRQRARGAPLPWLAMLVLMVVSSPVAYVHHA